MSNDGKERTLREDLYNSLSSISDSYDSSKEYIGYMDPVHGVVLVDASVLEEEFQLRNRRPSSIEVFPDVRNESSSQDMPEVEPNKSKESRPSESILLPERDDSQKAGAGCSNPAPVDSGKVKSIEKHSESLKTDSDSVEQTASSSAPKVPFKGKTMHEIAYERKMGCPVPTDATRSLSGFAIKQGKLFINSSTFNAFHDESHTEELAMGDTEKEKLTALVEKLNRENKKRASSVCILL